MPLRNTTTYLRDVLNYSKRAVEYVHGMTEQQFLEDYRTQDAASWCILIIGEVATHLLKHNTMEQLPNLPWAKMKGMRNRLVHEYDNIRADLVWETSSKGDLDRAISEIESFLSRQPPGEE
jgi:uncharacterized protein with HEPN domain